jgi:hypothetical protein
MLPNCFPRSGSPEGHSKWGRSHIPGYSFGASQGDPVVPPPAKLAANGAEKKQAKQSIEGAQLGGFELNGFAAWAFSPQPKHSRQPNRPGYRINSHLEVPFNDRMESFTAGFHLPRWNLYQATSESNLCFPWLKLRSNRQLRNTG